ncbi:MAG: YeeE/YedE family protein [Gammaproteobacteria bacterium]|nr:YeeE/YedE family protein [Gammaproteobacteria bacterium]
MNDRMNAIFTVVSGALFGFGLALSTMIKPEVVLDFLRFDDFGLLLVLGGAVGVTLIAYQLAPRLMAKPVFAAAFGQRPTETMKRTLVGSALFGIGWGICGVCPGPAIAGLGAGNWSLLIVVAAMALGAYVQGRLASSR